MRRLVLTYWSEDSSLRVVEGTCSHRVELQQSISGSIGSIYVFLGDTRSLCL
ncbi:unnamed protein product [Brassica rapa]|uniref:Uncharacterized protein n=1 Tax=Brassica campestris TaxID=3711 RepID=A0A8D9GY50_BRACM|nr:unnamed protein product [Brassica rapa]